MTYTKISQRESLVLDYNYMLFMTCICSSMQCAMQITRWVILTLKPAENFSEMRVYTIWACMETLDGVT